MEDRQDKQDAQRILLIKETILSAEKSLETAKSLIAQLESKYAPQKKTYGVAEGGKIVEGTFDGQLMIGMDGRQYPVPANYASKSKLVEGDMLKLVITDDGNFIYKQIGPFKRKRLLGVLRENKEEGGYAIEAEGRDYKVLLAAVTYHHVDPGDEIAVVVADTEEARWAAIENVTKKGAGSEAANLQSPFLKGEKNEDDVAAIKNEKKSKKEKKERDIGAKSVSEINQAKENEIGEELTPDLEEMEKELKKQVVQDN